MVRFKEKPTQPRPQPPVSQGLRKHDKKWNELRGLVIDAMVNTGHQEYSFVLDMMDSLDKKYHNK